jgi:hypothetical protein
MHATTWANEEFGSAELGDERLNERLLVMAQRLADRPGGKLTKVFEFGAELHGAYRFIENDLVSSDEMERARGESCARRLTDSAVTVVPIDQTSIKLAEQRKTENFGSVGTRSSGARGVQVMTALALDGEGVILGVLHQDRWLRSDERTPPRSQGRKGKRKDKRPAEQRESYAWIRALDGCHAQQQQHAPEVRPWYQVDQGADFWRVFDWAHQHHALLTARVGHERIVFNGKYRSHLHPWIEAQHVAYRYDLELPERTGRDRRDARTAHLSVRFGTTSVHFYSTKTKTTAITLSVVAVAEPRPPEGAEPIDWLLLTTFPVVNQKDAALVISNYTLRWRCEEFHRTLKTGACNIEQSELQTFENFCRLLVLESSVAARIERIKFLSRTQPDAPATVAYTREEIDMMIRLREQHMVRKKPGYRPSQTPPVSLVTRWVAELGGFIPSRSRGYPGTIVLSRGLVILQNAVLGARAFRLPASGCG